MILLAWFLIRLIANTNAEPLMFAILYAVRILLIFKLSDRRFWFPWCPAPRSRGVSSCWALHVFHSHGISRLAGMWGQSTQLHQWPCCVLTGQSGTVHPSTDSPVHSIRWGWGELQSRHCHGSSALNYYRNRMCSCPAECKMVCCTLCTIGSVYTTMKIFHNGMQSGCG